MEFNRTLEQSINTILRPDFKCTIHPNPIKREKSHYSFLQLNTLRITKRVNGGLQDCLLQIGKFIYYLDYKQSSVLIYNEKHRIVINQRFEIHIKKWKPNTRNILKPDVRIQILYMSEQKQFYFSIETDNERFPITGNIGMGTDVTSISAMRDKEHFEVCYEIARRHKLVTKDQKDIVFQIRIHDLNLAKGIWYIYSY